LAIDIRDDASSQTGTLSDCSDDKRTVWRIGEVIVEDKKGSRNLNTVVNGIRVRSGVDQTKGPSHVDEKNSFSAQPSFLGQGDGAHLVSATDFFSSKVIETGRTGVAYSSIGPSVQACDLTGSLIRA